MFGRSYEQRLESWSEFRTSLEESEDPLRDVIRLYKQAPNVSVYTDPWNQDTWPSPWELVHENQYDDFARVLGMCYSLQLTDRFKTSSFEIHICTVNSLSCLYLLFVDDLVLGYEDETIISRNKLPSDLQSQQTYSMPSLQ